MFEDRVLIARSARSPSTPSQHSQDGAVLGGISLRNITRTVPPGKRLGGVHCLSKLVLSLTLNQDGNFRNLGGFPCVVSSLSLDRGYSVWSRLGLSGRMPPPWQPAFIKIFGVSSFHGETRATQNGINVWSD
jgi:hypothetical protein